MKKLSVVALVLVGCSAGDDSAGDAVGFDGSALVTPLTCAVSSTYDVQFTGSPTIYRGIAYSAFMPAPAEDALVTISLCDPIYVGPSGCPTGATCTGTPPVLASCTRGSGYDVLPDGRARFACGLVQEQRSGSQVLSVNGQHWATVRVSVR